eukprot:5934457-Pleurochrysis_carterae.AAC.2
MISNQPDRNHSQRISLTPDSNARVSKSKFKSESLAASQALHDGVTNAMSCLPPPTNPTRPLASRCSLADVSTAPQIATRSNRTAVEFGKSVSRERIRRRRRTPSSIDAFYLPYL